MRYLVSGKVAVVAMIGLLALGANFPSPVLAAKEDRAASEKFVEEAKKYLKDGDANAAVIQLKNALQNDRDNVEARKLLGEIYLRVGNGPAAEKELKAALLRGARSKELMVQIARAYILQGKYDSVLKELPDEGGEDPIRLDVLNARGNAFLGLGMRRDALESFNEAERLGPRDVRTKVGSAKVLIGEGDLEGAEAKIDAALAIDPDFLEGLVLKGELARLKLDLDGAVAAFDRAIKVDDRNIPARLGRAAALIDQNKDDLARRDIDAVYALVPKQPLAGYLSALILAKQKDFTAALDILQQTGTALENHMPSIFLSGAVNYALNHLEQAADLLSRYVAAVPNNVRARKLLGATLVRKNDMEKAIQTLKPLVDRNIADPQVLALLGGAYMRTGKFAEGSELFERAVQAAPTESAIRTQLALSRLVQGESARAIGDLEAAVDLDPDARQASILLTLVHLRQGRYDDALLAAQKLRKAMPDNPLALNLIGAAQLGKGELGEARATFESALSMKRDFYPARMNLAQLDLREGRTDDAIANYRAIIESDPKHVGALLAMAEIARRQGKTEEVAEWLKQASEADPKSIAPKLRLIQYYSEQRDLQRALAVARELDVQVQNNPQVLEALGRTEIAAGERAAAVATFRRLTSIAANSPRAFHLLGGALIAVDDLEAARRSFKRAKAIDSAFLPADMALIELESRDGNIAEALLLADEIATRKPDSAVGPMLTGDIYVRAGEYGKAIAAYQRAASLEDTGVIALRLYNAMRAAGKVEAALENLQGWVNLHQDVAARHVLSSGYITAQRYDDAIRESEILMQKDPENPVLLNNLAWLYDQKGDTKAVDTAERALAKAPDTPEVMDTVGWILTRRGDAQRGLELLEKAHKAAPKQGDIAYHYAFALNKAGRTAEAVRLLERVLEAKIEFSEEESARNLLSGIRR